MKLIKSVKILTCVAGLLLSGCESWLDVKPVDKVLENQLYETEIGFKEALNGIYIELNQSSLYGGELMFYMVEVLAQRYNVGDVARDKNVIIYNYSDDDVKQRIDQIWKTAYSLIMNCNILIANADQKQDLFTGDNYALIKGEALALRAMLHFDLLRLFGPVYKTNSNDVSICYNEKFAYAASDFLPASRVMEKVVADLQEAEKLLANDPVITKGPQSSDAADGDNSLRYRTLRLNYYAVQGLLARAYLYAGDQQKALTMARKLVEVQEKWFPWVKRENVMVESNKSRDFVFSTELLFALQNKKRVDIFTKYFSPDVDATQILAPKKEILEGIYAGTDDWRYTSMWQIPKDGKLNYRCFYKYDKSEEARAHNYLLPMLRISEMYYIVAETTDDSAEALRVMNQVRKNRGLIPFGENEQIDMPKVVAEEYVKEFFGEGQLFFYYKRLNVPKIPAGKGGNDVVMDAAKYSLPVPDSELDYRD